MTSPITKAKALAILALTMSFGSTVAEVVTLRQKSDLKAEKFTDAKTVTTLDGGVRVDVVRREGAWAFVETDGSKGWLRTTSFGKPSTLPTNGVLAFNSGRDAHGDHIATTGIRGYSKPSSSDVHGLIIVVGEYEQPITPLQGARRDVDSAKEIARRMGVPDQNLRVLANQDATISGMRKSFDELASRVQNDDQVFIYFSGHGNRSIAIEEPPGDRCAEALVAYNGYGMLDSELEARLKQLSSKAQKIVVFIDACHSGGVTSRRVAKADAEFTPKFWSKGIVGEACSKPINVLTRDLTRATNTVGSGGNNVVYIAASKEDEVSFDQATKGGVATQAWLKCMTGAANDTDRSGGISAEELRICAQDQVNKILEKAPGILPSHVTLAGNRNLVLSYATKTAENQPQVSEPQRTDPPSVSTIVKPEINTPVVSTTVKPELNTPVVSTTVKPEINTPVVSTTVKPEPTATLKDIFNNRDDRRLVSITADAAKLRINKDRIGFSVTTRESGYVYLLMVGSDRKTFDLIFPNKLDSDNEIKAGETLKLPRANWELKAQGPLGADTVLAIVSASPRNFSSAGLKSSGPFSIMDAGAARDVQMITSSGNRRTSADCTKTHEPQDQDALKRCSNAYGAAMVTIQEYSE